MGFFKEIINIAKKELNDFEYIEKYNYDVSGFNYLQKVEINAGLKRGLDVSWYAKHEFGNLKMGQIRLGLEAGLDPKYYANSELGIRQMISIKEGLEKSLDVSVYADPVFDYKMMDLIRQGLENGLDVSRYAKYEFTYGQMKEIKIGLENKVNVNIYSNKKFDEYQMCQIRLGLENKVNVKKYLNEKLDYNQMLQIREGLQSKVDVSIYSDIKFNAEQMQEIRLGLVNKVNTKIYADNSISYEDMKKIREDLEDKINVSIYLNKGLNKNQIECVREGLREGLNARIYANKNYNIEKMNFIKECLKSGINIEKYVVSGYDLNQLKQIKFGIIENLDVSKYAKSKFNAEQMKEIRLGLKDKIDIQDYLDPKLTAEEMELIRLDLTSKMNREIQNNSKMSENMKSLGYKDYESLDEAISVMKSHIVSQADKNISWTMLNKEPEYFNNLVQEANPLNRTLNKNAKCTLMYLCNLIDIVHPDVKKNILEVIDRWIGDIYKYSGDEIYGFGDVVNYSHRLTTLLGVSDEFFNAYMDCLAYICTYLISKKEHLELNKTITYAKEKNIKKSNGKLSNRELKKLANNKNHVSSSKINEGFNTTNNDKEKKDKVLIYKNEFQLINELQKEICNTESSRICDILKNSIAYDLKSLLSKYDYKNRAKDANEKSIILYYLIQSESIGDINRELCKKFVMSFSEGKPYMEGCNIVTFLDVKNMSLKLNQNKNISDKFYIRCLEFLNYMILNYNI